ncbi:TfoX/Sxy family transcriptional regulator of competence genes [Dysgonomonas hofstadii]|uniref:TfoX/Sxy family transcriptional regulator of competence genes n=1 Tax=Dysgonomonas hofstadii TaxID=637886 RepID=A0A840CYF1_9BACT|nr:TfoX/Sxy family transcriptional regulator of competence genes [Dysgonomonas hofstadii]
MEQKRRNMFYNIKIYYLCTVFFMVLDLRLTMKIGCRDDNLFFFI